MKILIVEDDFISRMLIQRILSPYGKCDIAIHGKEALDAFEMAWTEEQPYQLMCLDIMMPEMDGQEVLRQIRTRESEMGIDPGSQNSVKIIMISALVDPENFFKAFRNGCETYLAKPIDKQKLLDMVRKFELV